MNIFADEISRIRVANELDEIRRLASGFSAQAAGDNGVLYSGRVGVAKTESVALQLAARTDQPIINNTARAKFLADPDVAAAIESSARRVFRAEGQSIESARSSAVNFLYGDAEQLDHNPTSLKGCLWGEASREFSGSLRGHVMFVGTSASPDRVFGRVELEAILANPKVETLGGIETSRLRAVVASDGIPAAVNLVQERFRQVADDVFITSRDGGGRAKRVVMAREGAEGLGVDGTRFASKSVYEAAGLPRIGSENPAATVVADVDVGLSARPMTLRVGAGLGAGAAIVDAAITRHRMATLYGQGNAVAAESTLIHYGSRGIGGASGAVAGFAVGGPVGAIVFGVTGAVAGDKIAEFVDKHRIYNQSDKDGNSWTFDASNPANGWRRREDVTTADASTGTTDTQTRTIVAGGELASRFQYQATVTSTELVLGSPATPRNPFKLEAGDGDTHSLMRADWTRDPATGAWQREVVTAIHDRGFRVTENETALAGRAVQLDAMAAQVITANAARSPQAIAARFEEGYVRNGWSTSGPVPDAVVQAREDRTTLASDGRRYALGDDGSWAREGSREPAPDMLRAELDAARAVRDQIVADIRTAPSAPQRNRNDIGDMVASAYAHAGVAPRPEVLDAATRALESARVENDITGRMAVTLKLNPDTRTYDVNSPIALLQPGADGTLVERTSIRVDTAVPALALHSGSAVPQRQAHAMDPITVTAPRTAAVEPTAPSHPVQAPSPPQIDLRDPNHPGHPEFRKVLGEVHRMETSNGIAPGPHSEKAAAALMVEAARAGQAITNVAMGRDGQILGIERWYADQPVKHVGVDAGAAVSKSMSDLSSDWAAARSPHYASVMPSTRTSGQAQSLEALSPDDRAMFDKVRAGTPAHISDEVVAHAALQARVGGIKDASQIDRTLMSGDRLFVVGTTPGMRAVVDVTAPAPALQETSQALQAAGQQREQHRVATHEIAQDGPARALGR